MVDFVPNKTHPDYRINQLKPKTHRYCVAIFVINEGERLLSQLREMSGKGIESVVDIVIADGGSTDGSTETGELAALGVSALLTKTGPGKLGAQMRMAFHWAHANGYEGVITIDGNGKDGVGAIPDFVKLLEAGFDHIQGSRFIPGGFQQHTPKSRLIGLKVLHVPLMRAASGFKYTDTTNGFRAYSMKLILSDELKLFRPLFTGYELHYYIAIKAARFGFRCIETPVSRVYPKHGKTPTKISPLRGNLTVIGKLLGACLGRYNPK